MIVRIRFTIWPIHDPTCADRTASAIVSELTIRTPVFSAPSLTLRWLLAAAHASGYQ